MVSVVLTDAEISVAVMVSVVVAGRGIVTIVNVADVFPAGMMTVFRKAATVVPADIEIARPPTGAGEPIVKVATVVLPPVTLL